MGIDQESVYQSSITSRGLVGINSNWMFFTELNQPGMIWIIKYASLQQISVVFFYLLELRFYNFHLFPSDIGFASKLGQTRKLNSHRSLKWVK